LFFFTLKSWRCIPLPQQRNPTAEAVNTVCGSNGADVSDQNVWEMAVWFGDLHKFGCGHRHGSLEDSHCLGPGRVSMSNGSSPGSSLSAQIESRCGVCWKSQNITEQVSVRVRPCVQRVPGPMQQVSLSEVKCFTAKQPR